MSTLPASLKMACKRSSSCSEYTQPIPNTNNHENSPQTKIGFLQKSLDLSDSLESPALLYTRSVLDYFEPSKFRSYKSTRPSTIKLSPKGGFEDLVSTPEISAVELLTQDDEEITPKKLPTPKEADFDISINMVINEIIASTNACVSYPCYVSVKPREDYLPEQLSVDLVVILDIKNHGLSTITNTLRDFLAQLNENDRLSLFTTQQGSTKRFPLRVMNPAAKSELMEELNLLTHTNFNVNKELSLPQVLRTAMKYLRERKYRNHLSAIFLLTDSIEESDFSRVVNKEAKISPEENPLLFTFGIEQKSNKIELQEVCEALEGRYQHIETPESLNAAMVECLLELSYIRLKNIKMTFEIESNEMDDGTLRIARVYEKKTLIEESSGFAEAKTNYFSMKEGIDVALEVEVCKGRAIPNEEIMPYFLTFSLTGESVSENAQVIVRKQKELNISKMHPLLRMMPKKLDKMALESFYRVKVAKIVSYSVKMAGDGYLKQSVQSLNKLKKELYTFTMLRSETIQKMMKTIECTLNNLQSPLFRSKEKLSAIKDLNSMIGI